MVPNDDMLILIVDDNANNLKVLGSILSLHKYKIALATNGDECLTLMTKQIPDLIFLDIMMPGINGFEVCQTIKSNKSTAHVPVIFVSALSSPNQVSKAFESGGVDYITKPFNKDEILARAKVHLQIKKERDALLEKIESLESKNHPLTNQK